MKKFYGTPTIAVLLYDVEDVITASVGAVGDDNDGNWQVGWSN